MAWVPITHSFGCCIEHNGDGVQQLRRTLGGFVKHANFAGVVVIGLGCEANQMGAMFLSEGIEAGKLVAPLVIQEQGGTRKTVDAAIAAVEAMLPTANLCRRETVSASHLTVALQCGGSDGYSGITANPALGVAVDLLVAQGGTAILSETPEIYGAEHPADATRCLSRGGPRHRGPDQVVGNVRGQGKGQHRQQPYAGQQGGWPDHHP